MVIVSQLLVHLTWVPAMSSEHPLAPTTLWIINKTKETSQNFLHFLLNWWRFMGLRRPPPTKKFTSSPRMEPRNFPGYSISDLEDFDSFSEFCLSCASPRVRAADYNVLGLSQYGTAVSSGSFNQSCLWLGILLFDNTTSATAFAHLCQQKFSSNLKF